ncbi:MAG: hypothetical protein R2753_06700 [Chitinophagales bacterium]
MRILAVIFIVILSNTSAWGQYRDYGNLNTLDLKGKIKSLEEREFKIIEKIEDTVRLDLTVQRNILFNQKDDNIGIWVIYLKSNNKNFTGSHYNEQGTKLKDSILFYKNDSLVVKGIGIYESNKNTTKITIYDKSSNIIQCVENTYDENKNKKKTYAYLSNGDFSFKSRFDYDKKGNIAKSYSYYTKNFVGRISKYKYDSNNNRTEFKVLDANGNQIERTVYVYDEFENMIESHSFNAENVLTMKSKYETEYDEKSNWTKMTKYEYLAPSFEVVNGIMVEERAIEYY